MASNGVVAGEAQKNNSTRSSIANRQSAKPKKKNVCNGSVVIKRNQVNKDGESSAKLNGDFLIHQIYVLFSKLSQQFDEKYERHVTPEGYDHVQKIVKNHMGFCLEKRPSSLPAGGGTGVFVSEGEIEKNSLVAFYPGTVYRQGETVFLQSFCNKFVFRCVDGTLIDGNDRALSKLIHRSCTFRDRLGPMLLNDMTWLTKMPANPLAVGQYVNNSTKDNLANVIYHEVDFPVKYLSMEMRRFVPNALYATTGNCDYLRMVLLISLRQITTGEELFSNYFTIVDN